MVSSASIPSLNSGWKTFQEVHIPIQYLVIVPRILFLFTASDIRTVMIPVALFTTLSTPYIDLHSFLAALFWTWLHLLQFCVSNQSLHIEEDKLNKPWRPIPSSLIHISTTRQLRWLLLPACICLSVHYRITSAGVLLSLAFAAHNELGFGSHWLLRNACNAWGYTMFNAGAVGIANPEVLKDGRLFHSFVYNGLVIFTTIHAQDFRDVEGDKIIGRQTLPIVYPEGSRLAILVSMWGWTSGLIATCHGIHAWLSLIFGAVGLVIGFRFYCFRSARDDRMSYTLYNVGLFCDPFSNVWRTVH
ncbi:UbiA prenyltransferase family-domain-containing protein [Lentinula aff. detonsa]|uniref:UbiA prenyltransferase family-domain-containing protein n=1 Tax=Lentinula aff. detonsa TaxID=2804958 RepID=A0AA38NM11_9AGAR|nr:UbiA prenyltransferase family-domain-containing protein [Lentinula aff. detonsa]